MKLLSIWKSYRDSLELWIELWWVWRQNWSFLSESWHIRQSLFSTIQSSTLKWSSRQPVFWSIEITRSCSKLVEIFVSYFLSFFVEEFCSINWLFLFFIKSGIFKVILFLFWKLFVKTRRHGRADWLRLSELSPWKLIQSAEEPKVNKYFKFGTGFRPRNGTLRNTSPEDRNFQNDKFWSVLAGRWRVDG